MELKKAFADLQTKMVATKSMLKNHDSQIYFINKEVDSARLTGENEVNSLLSNHIKSSVCVLSCLLPSLPGEALSKMPAETRAYESVGRMFVKQDLTVIQKNLNSQMDECKDKIKKLETNKEYLSRNLKESEDNLRELVAQKQKARA